MAEKETRYTVKQLADLANVSVRTLHYYDEIGLLAPAEVGGNGYRYYDDGSLYRLQQILLYREMDLELEKIKAILSDPQFELVSALQSHRNALTDRIARLNGLIKTVDATIFDIVGEVEMSKDEIFKGFSEEEQEKYAREAEQNWGESVRESQKLWNSYSQEEKDRIMEEGSLVYQELAANMHTGPQSPETQALLVRWHQHLRYFYEPSMETLRGLGNMYNDHPDFRANIGKIHPDLPAFLQKAINHYVDELEDAWLRKELGILEEED